MLTGQETTNFCRGVKGSPLSVPKLGDQALSHCGSFLSHSLLNGFAHSCQRSVCCYVSIPVIMHSFWSDLTSFSHISEK